MGVTQTDLCRECKRTTHWEAVSEGWRCTGCNTTLWVGDSSKELKYTCSHCGSAEAYLDEASQRVQCNKCLGSSPLKSPADVDIVVALGLPVRAMQATERVMAFGAEKYKDHNSYLTDGRPAIKHVEACDRHLEVYDRGELADPETGEHPLAHAIARLMMALELELRNDND